MDAKKSSNRPAKILGCSSITLVSAIFDCTTVNLLCERVHQQSQVFPHPAASSQGKDRHT